ncbi:MAG TPA: hypothetical protein IGS52_23200 [Oscillatoriaceae cyanobacterium M33_DOE_052]|uniref:Uncharacterized protein n=1 Tax=Planktothricoides sp. SpSt-374 TaxID=2282167 RepID=A0A7C3VHQ1_9CYAN|nr:hypothetical protein [Oscillatoriaceae cyanobacterium M33_DOE_052]
MSSGTDMDSANPRGANFLQFYSHHLASVQYYQYNRPSIGQKPGGLALLWCAKPQLLIFSHQFGLKISCFTIIGLTVGNFIMFSTIFGSNEHEIADNYLND